MKATQNLEQEQPLNTTLDAMTYVLDKYIGINQQQQQL